MNHKIRLGPIAIFLSVVAVVLTTLAILATATTNADKVLAERFAGVTRTRYELEAEGEKFLMAYDELAASGGSDAAALGAEAVAGDGGTVRGYKVTLERDGYTLDIEVSAPDSGGTWEVTRWKVNKIWNADTPMDNIWLGGGK